MSVYLNIQNTSSENKFLDNNRNIKNLEYNNYRLFIPILSCFTIKIICK